MASDTTGGGVVKLRAENIDLRVALDEAHNKISKLVLLVSQAMTREPSVVLDSDIVAGDAELAAMLRCPPPTATASPGTSGETGRKSSAKGDARADRLQLQLDESQRAARDLDARCAELERERDAIASALVDLRQSKAALETEYKAKQLASEEREMQLVMQLEELRDGAPQGGDAADPQEEAAVDAEVARRVEEGVFSAMIDFEEKLDALRSENESLRVTVAENHRVVAERDAAIQSMERAVSERLIAYKVRDGSLEDAKQLRVELQNARDRVKALEAELRNAAQREERSAAEKAELQRTAQEAATKAATSDKVSSRAQQLVSDSDERFQKLKEELRRSEDARAEAELRVAALQQQVGSLKRKSDSTSETLRAIEEARRQERDDRTQARREAQLKRLHKEYNDSSSNEVARAVFDRVQAEYNKLLNHLQEAQTPDDKEEIISKLLYYYEWNLQKLRDEAASMRTVGDIRESDATHDMQSRIDEVLSQVEILRMQLREAGHQPCV